MIWTDQSRSSCRRVAADLKANAGKCVVIPGEQASPEVHLAAYRAESGSGQGWQNGRLHRDGESDADRAGRRSEVAGCGYECGQGGVAGDPGCESDVRGAGRSGICGGVERFQTLSHIWARMWTKPAAVRIGTSTRRTTWRAGPMRGVRWHRHDRAADDRPAVWRQTAHDVLQALLDNPDVSAYDAVRANVKITSKGDFAALLAQGAARWLG